MKLLGCWRAELQKNTEVQYLTSIRDGKMASTTDSPFKFLWSHLNPLNPAGRFSGLRKQGPRNPAGRFSGICYGVSKTRRAFKPAHVRLIIKWFVYTGRYQATLRSQVESSSLFSFLTICNLLTGFWTRYTNLRRKYGGDTQCMWRYRYSLHVMDNVEELYNQKIGFWDRNGGIQGTC